MRPVLQAFWILSTILCIVSCDGTVRLKVVNEEFSKSSTKGVRGTYVADYPFGRLNFSASTISTPAPPQKAVFWCQLKIKNSCDSLIVFEPMLITTIDNLNYDTVRTYVITLNGTDSAVSDLEEVQIPIDRNDSCTISFHHRFGKSTQRLDTAYIFLGQIISSCTDEVLLLDSLVLIIPSQ